MLKPDLALTIFVVFLNRQLMFPHQTLMGDGGSHGPIWQPSAEKYTRLDNELQTANSQFIEEQHTQQQVLSKAVHNTVNW